MIQMSGKKVSSKRKTPKLTIKKWKFEFEPEILKEWEENGSYENYKMKSKSVKPIFSIDTPPPYPRENGTSVQFRDMS